MKLIALVLAAFLMSAHGVAHAQQVLRLSGFEAPNLTPIATHLLSRAYGELGIKVQAVIAHPRRALLHSSSGRTDGELVRVRQVGQEHRSLLRVEVPLVTSRTFAYTNRPELKGKSLDELYLLRAGHVDGARFAAELANRFSEVWTARKPEQLFNMLKYGRVDLVIVSEQTGKQMIEQLDLAGVFALQPTLSEVRYYHYLHERHARLVPEIEAALRKILNYETDSDNDGLERSGIAASENCTARGHRIDCLQAGVFMRFMSSLNTSTGR